MKVKCQHKKGRIIVIAAFADYEETAIYCPDCDTSFNALRKIIITKTK